MRGEQVLAIGNRNDQRPCKDSVLQHGEVTWYQKTHVAVVIDFYTEW